MIVITYTYTLCKRSVYCTAKLRKKAENYGSFLETKKIC